MTGMTNEATASGRTLDYRIAIRVFGSRIFMSGGTALDDVPHYSTRIEDAWKVVEKMREGGWVVGIYIDDEPWEDSAGVGTHHCSLLGCNRGRADCTDIRESADSTPLVICIAAMRAMDAPSAVDPSIPKRSGT